MSMKSDIARDRANNLFRHVFEDTMAITGCSASELSRFCARDPGLWTDVTERGRYLGTATALRYADQLAAYVFRRRHPCASAKRGEAANSTIDAQVTPASDRFA